MTSSALPTTTTTAAAATPATPPMPAAPLERRDEPPGRFARLQVPVAIAFGVTLTLTMQGYHFGRSNHTVYLIDALRHTAPDLLRNDWFATQTLQYHAAFGLLTRALMELHIIQIAFLIGHGSLAILMHVAWWKIVKAFGGGVGAFLVSELIFHVSAGGTALGMYQFLQDGAFLPSNIASVAFLWAVYLFMTDRRGTAALLFGVSGLFHLNYAVVAPMLWIALAAIAWMKDRRRPTTTDFFAVAAMGALCLINIVPAFVAVSQRSGKMPLAEFVDIYVNLRHPHHYAPLAWPVLLWLSFLWPIPLALLYWRGRRGAAFAQARRVVAVISILLLVALLGAGVWYVSETLVQLSLWRFSVFVKLLTCIGAAMWIVGKVKDDRLAGAAAAILGIAVVAACVLRGPYFGIYHHPYEDRAYLAACDWIRDNTPVDAVFLVPPHEEQFRLRARRAIVVNYKCVPQLSGELPAWRQRLEQVLDMDIRQLPTPFRLTLFALRDRYDRLPPAHYARVAQRYHARYVLVGHRLPEEWEPKRVAAMNDASSEYFLYDLQR